MNLAQLLPICQPVPAGVRAPVRGEASLAPGAGGTARGGAGALVGGRAPPLSGEGATYESCSRCPWMEMNGLRNLCSSLGKATNEIFVDEEIRLKAYKLLERMMRFPLQD